MTAFEFAILLMMMLISIISIGDLSWKGFARPRWFLFIVSLHALASATASAIAIYGVLK